LFLVIPIPSKESGEIERCPGIGLRLIKITIGKMIKINQI